MSASSRSRRRANPANADLHAQAAPRTFVVDEELLRDALRAALAVHGVGGTLPVGTARHIAHHLAGAAAAGRDPNAWLRGAALDALKLRRPAPSGRPH